MPRRSQTRTPSRMGAPAAGVHGDGDDGTWQGTGVVAADVEDEVDGAVVVEDVDGPAGEADDRAVRRRGLSGDPIDVARVRAGRCRTDRASGSLARSGW